MELPEEEPENFYWDMITIGEFGKIMTAISEVKNPKPSPYTYLYEATDEADYVTLTTPNITYRAIIVNCTINVEVNGHSISGIGNMLCFLQLHYMAII